MHYMDCSDNLCQIYVTSFCERTVNHKKGQLTGRQHSYNKQSKVWLISIQLCNAQLLRILNNLSSFTDIKFHIILERLPCYLKVRVSFKRGRLRIHTAWWTLTTEAPHVLTCPRRVMDTLLPDDSLELWGDFLGNQNPTIPPYRNDSPKGWLWGKIPNLVGQGSCVWSHTHTQSRWLWEVTSLINFAWVYPFNR